MKDLAPCPKCHKTGQFVKRTAVHRTKRGTLIDEGSVNAYSVCLALGILLAILATALLVINATFVSPLLSPAMAWIGYGLAALCLLVAIAGGFTVNRLPIVADAYRCTACGECWQKERTA